MWRRWWWWWWWWESPPPPEVEPTTTTPTPTVDTTRSISGGGVKGPLANAIVNVYPYDASQSGFKGSVAATAATNAAAAITGLALPFPLNPPYILEFTSDGGTTDITTGQAPVIGTLRSVITHTLLDKGEQIYATPLTTLAVDIAIASSNTSTTAAQFEAALTDAAAQVVSTLGFGMNSSIDIFDTPPLVDSATISSAEQADVAAYRTAVEAVTAIAFQIDQQSAGGDTDSVLSEIAADLADGGGIDGSAGTQINANTLQVLDQDPATLPIPNDPSNRTVSQVTEILVAETSTTGTTTSTTELDAGGSITITPEPAAPNPDSDGDGTLNVDDAFPNDPNETIDSDGDGIGNNTDPDDNNNGILDVDENQTPTPVANDTDQDGVADDSDNCPAIFNPSQNDLDGDEVLGTGGGDACDDDIDGDMTLNGVDAFPLNGGESIDTDSDGIGNNTDSDDDNDGVNDGSDTGVAPSGAPSVGVDCSLLRDCDGDGVFDGSDFDRTDALVTSNFAPVANDDSITVDEDAALFSITVTANDTDDDGNPGDSVSLTAISVNNTSLGTAVINGNNIDYTPVANESGTDTFTYTVTDGSVSAIGSVTVTVIPVNDAPVGVDDAATTNEDTAVTTGNVLVNDTDNDGDTLSVAAGDPTATQGTVLNNNDGTFTYTPNLNANGADSFTYTLNDGNGESATATVNITITPVNDVPVANNDSVTNDEDTPFNNIAVLANDTDVEGDTLSVISGTPTASNGTVTNNGDGTFNYVPDADFNGQDSFIYTISDSNGGNDIGTVTVTVSAVNDNPVAVDDAVTTDEDVVIVDFDVLANDTDVDADTLTVNSATANQGAVTINAGNTLTYTPNANFNGSDTISYSIADGNGGSAAANIVVTIIAVNDAPVAQDDAVTNDEDTPFNNIAVLANDTDVEGDTLSVISGTPTASNGTITNNGDGTFNYVPDADFNGQDSFIYTISDSNGGNDMGTVTVTVSAVNDNPVAVDDAVTTDEEVVIVDFDVLANDFDVDADTLTVNSATANQGAVTINAGNTLTYTPNANFNGSDTISYSIADGNGGSANASVAVTITPVNDNPVAVDDAVTTDEDVAIVNYDVLANDTDVDPDTLSITSATASQGTVTINAGITITYTPDADFNGSDTISYSIDDGNGGSASAFVAVTITPVNDAPVPVADAFNAGVSTETSMDVLANDSDVDAGTTLTITAVSAPSRAATITFVGGNTITFTDTTGTPGTTTFTYDITDGETPVTTTLVTVTVVANVPPVVTGETATTDEDTPVTTVNVLANDTDGGDGPDAVSIDTFDALSANGGDVSDNGDNTFTYTPAADFDGSDSFTYTVTDGSSTTVGTVSITVTAINDDPVGVADTGSTDEDTQFTTVNVLDNDTDADMGDTLEVGAGNPTAGKGTVVNNGDGTFTYTPSLNQNGEDTFDYSVEDGNGGSASATVTVTITPVNDAPTIAGTPTTTINSGADYSFTPTAGDVDIGDTLTFSIQSQPGWATFDDSDGTLSGVPPVESVGGDFSNIIISVTDNTESVDLPAFDITVNPAPVGSAVWDNFDWDDGSTWQ